MSSITPTIVPHTNSAELLVRRTASGHDEVEKLSAKLHLIHQEEAKRQGLERHTAIYEDLAEDAKEFYRAQAQYVLDHYIRR